MVHPPLRIILIDVGEFHHLIHLRLKFPGQAYILLRNGNAGNKFFE